MYVHTYAKIRKSFFRWEISEIFTRIPLKIKTKPNIRSSYVPSSLAMYKKIRKLQKNLHKILRNQNEIFDLLNSVSKSRNRIPPAESNFFPMKKTEDLLILDKALADTNNKYISQMSKILKPVGTTSVQPLKKRFPLLFEDHLLMQLNFEGIGNKESFKQFKNINRAIFDIQQKHGYTPMEYIKEIREAFRIFQNRFLNKHTK